MNVPDPTKTTTRLILAIGRHQDGSKGITELAEESDEPLAAINGDKREAFNHDLIREEHEGRKTVLQLTADGMNFYEAAEQMAEALED